MKYDSFDKFIHDPCLLLYLDLTEFVTNRNFIRKKVIEAIMNDNPAINNVVKEMEIKVKSLLLKTAPEFFHVFPFDYKFFEPIKELYLFEKGSENLREYFDNIISNNEDLPTDKL